MGLVQKLVTQDSFVNGTLVTAGNIATYDEAQLKGDEGHIKDVGDFQMAPIQISAIGPTGPNPTAPQQIPTDARQGPGGIYTTPGKILVGEVTADAGTRLEQANLTDPDLEDKASKTIAKAMAEGPDLGFGPAVAGDPNDLVGGTVAEITADLGSKTDEELNAIKAAEAAGKSRTGVISAIDAELDARKA